MLVCPFLKKLSVTTINKDVQQIMTFIPKCPFARRLFEKSGMSTGMFHSLSNAAPEKAPDEPVVCKDVAECLFKRCPYSSSGGDSDSSALTGANPCEGTLSPRCSSGSVKNVNGLSIPKTCALFLGWKASGAEHDKKTTQMQETMVNSVANKQNTVVEFDYSAFFHSEIHKKKQDSTYRVFKRVLRDADHFPFADDYSTGAKRRVAIWCSNDYLGMSWHPKVREAAVTAIQKHGVGSGGTRNISGNSVLHEALESELAQLHGKPSALIFTSCYVANEATLHTLGTRLPGVTIVSDAGNHASMIHGIRTSRAPKRIYRHNDVEGLRSILTSLPREAPKLVAFETVHSMTGDVCPLKSLLDVSEEHNALTFVDEVHAVGLYGDHGAGVAERDGLMHRIDAISGTLGKAFASVGGYIAGSHELVDMIRSYASGFIFTTSLPPPVLAAARASIAILKTTEGRELRAEHQRRVEIVRKRLQQEGLPVLEAPSHILPLHVGDAELCTRISTELLTEHNIYVQSINYPTVDRGDERLRIAPTPHHTDELTDQLVDALCSIWGKYDLPLTKSDERQAVPLAA
ncbi:5-aminolevulinate synthase nonspecific mitochondrial [Fasciola gigantica]|uniref:5-aminolevulinate synthase n=1 Tax=Fasciola gigantica TaxID=46835 RepID=A0A504Y9P9_FASGI|nr:5-aminolevulinate synthase nonspecific mitochondrial [Fasciola gigantica]